MLLAGWSEESFRRLTDDVALGRLGQADAIARAFFLLASADAPPLSEARGVEFG
jgi:hypothetical protein